MFVVDFSQTESGNHCKLSFYIMHNAQIIKWVGSGHSCHCFISTVATMTKEIVIVLICKSLGDDGNRTFRGCQKGQTQNECQSVELFYLIQ